MTPTFDLTRYQDPLTIQRAIYTAKTIAIVGLSTNVWMLAAILVVGGLGGAAFHPPAAAMVHRVSGRRHLRRSAQRLESPGRDAGGGSWPASADACD